jgi:imidazolonepropionase-like amidohydrolase
MRSWRILLVAAALVVPATPAAAETVAITNAHIYSMGPAGEIRSGTVLIRDNKIASVGSDVQVPNSARRIDAHGRVVTPGLMMVGTAITIVDLPSYGILDDSSTQSSLVSAAYDVQYSVNPEAPEVADARAEGITRAVVTPEVRGRERGAMFFGGQAALVRLADSRNLLTKAHVGVTMRAGAEGAALVGGGRGAQIAIMRSVFADVRRFAANRQAYDEARMRELHLSDLDLEALVPVVEGREPLIVKVERASDISTVLDMAADEKIHIVLLDASEGWVVAKEIAAAHVPVIVDPEGNIPDTLNTLGATYDNAARLQAAGVTIAFEAVHARPDDLVRSPRVVVGHLVGQTSLSKEAALAGLTTGAAKIAGVSDRLGALAPGMIADVVLWDGDPLEATSTPAVVFIDGQQQPLATRQELLGERYLRNYRASGVIPESSR